MIDFKRETVLCVFLALLIVCPRSAQRAEAWSISGHEIIVSRACRLFPGSWGDFFRYYEWLLNDTVAYPDTFYKGRDPAESSRHFVDLEIWNESRPETGTLPQAVETFGKDMSDSIKSADWNRVLLDAGRLAHYVSDICQPYHSTVNYDPATKSGIRLHAVLDGALRDHLSEIRLTSSFQTARIVNFKDHALFLAKQSNSFLAEINSTLIDQGLPWSSRLTEIIENRTNTAVVATMNVWHTAILASGFSAPTLPEPKTLKIAARSTLQAIDTTHDNVFAFTVTDRLGVKTASEIRAEVAGIVLETELHRDLADPLGSYRTLLPADKLKNLRGNIELGVTALREGYFSAKLIVPLRIEEPHIQLDYMIYLATAAATIMILSFALLIREYRKQRQMK